MHVETGRFPADIDEFAVNAKRVATHSDECRLHPGQPPDSRVPFLWRDIGEYDRPRPGDAEVRERSRRHGIFDGLTIPSHLPGEAHGSVSFAWGEGHQIPPEALAFAQSIGPFVFEAARRLALPMSETLRPRLTDRQIECLLWAARGKSNSVIAQLLDVSEDTVREHLRNARAAYDAPTRIALAIRALFDSAICFGDVAGG